jgi:proline dehydrogenase
VNTTNPLRNLIFWLSTKKAVTSRIGRLGMRYGFARRFVAGETLDEALRAILPFAQSGQPIILNHLGENVASTGEAHQARDSYVQMLRSMHDAGVSGNIAVKLTQLGLDFDPQLALSLAGEIAAKAATLKNTIEIDMESSAYTDATLRIFEAVQLEHGNVGIAIQAYLFRSQDDLERLAPLKPKVRLVKGAYREPANVAFREKSDVDANYRKLLDQILGKMSPPSDNGPRVAVATHDPALLDYAFTKIRQLHLRAHQYEFQMLLGIRRDLQEKVLSEGHPFRVYVPFGEAWVPYFMRRLSERPANLSFVLRSLFAESNTTKS